MSNDLDKEIDMKQEAHSKINGFLKEYPVLKYLFLATAIAIMAWGFITPI